jgi:uncharacterized protein
VSVRVWKLDEAAVLDALQGWAERLGRADATVRAVVLFGSLARGEATPLSDADVLILLGDSADDFDDRLVTYKPVGLGIAVEVFPYTLAEAARSMAEGWGMVRPALAEGRVLFSAPGFDFDGILNPES